MNVNLYVICSSLIRVYVIYINLERKKYFKLVNVWLVHVVHIFTRNEM